MSWIAQSMQWQLYLIQINIKTKRIGTQMDILTSKQENKENAYIGLNKQLQRLKVQLNDKTFEINKLQQDYAEERAKQFIEFHKERQNLNKIIKQLKEKLQFQNQQWEKKVQQVRQKSIQDNIILKQQYQQAIKTVSNALRQEYQNTFKQQIVLLKKSLDEQDFQSKQKIAMLQSQKCNEIESIKTYKDQIIKQMERQFKFTLEIVKIQNEKTTKSLQNIYIAERNTKQAITLQLEAHIQQSVKERIGLEHKIQQITLKNAQLTNEIGILNIRIKQMTEDISIRKQMHQDVIKELNITKLKDIQKIAVEYSKKIESQVKNYESQILKIKTSMKQVCSIYQQKEKRWEERGQMLLKSISGTENKGEEAKIIKKLEFQLSKKQNLLQKQRQSLRNCKLQLENMEDIYDKMFVTNNYLYKFRSKSFKVKKMRVPNILNQSNNSIYKEERIYTEGDKQN